MVEQWSMAANHKEISDLPQNKLSSCSTWNSKNLYRFLLLKDQAEFLEYVQAFPTDEMVHFFMQMTNLKLGF